APILEQLSNIDITENQSVNYTLENIDAAKRKAVEDAMRRARESANAAAAAAGRSIGDLSYASVDVFEPSLPRPLMGFGRMQAENAPAPAAAPTSEFTPQKVTATAHVNTLFLLK
ncbi:MAG: SIMPL domain-containing protein, partial [Acidobacteriaceae bacterium]|nr:SIMPL domain-containing protein [Acidobacteriaceae bacterium]